MALINPCFKDQNLSHLGEKTLEKKKEKRRREEEEEEEEEEGRRSSKSRSRGMELLTLSWNLDFWYGSLVVFG